MYPYVVKASYWDEEDGNHSITCLVYGSDIAAVAKRMEQYYDPETITITCVGDFDQLFEVSNEIADMLILGNGNYADGVKIFEKENEKHELDT